MIAALSLNWNFSLHKNGINSTIPKTANKTGIHLILKFRNNQLPNNMKWISLTWHKARSIRYPIRIELINNGQLTKLACRPLYHPKFPTICRGCWLPNIFSKDMYGYAFLHVCLRSFDLIRFEFHNKEINFKSWSGNWYNTEYPIIARWLCFKRINSFWGDKEIEYNGHGKMGFLVSF